MSSQENMHPSSRISMNSQAVRWARNTCQLMSMVRQCSAEAELAQTKASVRMP